MATSPYKIELEKFKADLPKVMQKHIEMNGLDICTPGLKGFFDDLGIEWEPPRRKHYVYIRGELDLSDDEAAQDDEMQEFEKELIALAKTKKFWGPSSTLSVDEYYQ